MLPAPVGAPLALLYGSALVVRRALAPAPFRAAAGTVCVGNLTVGGTGKTPAVAWVVARLREAGRRPVILTRGYGGDEPALLEAQCPGTLVLADPDRARSAARAVSQGADALVLDDGFQHLGLARDLDLVLVDASAPWGGGRLLPWGRLREPKAALRRAGAVLLTRVDQAGPEALDALRKEVRALAPDAVHAESVHRARDPQAWAGRRVLAVSGIGNPQAFERTLAALGAHIAASRRFRDHHPFTDGEVAALAAEARALGAEVVTTEKDRIRLARFPEAAGWGVLAVRLEVTAGAAALCDAVLRAAARAGGPSSGPSS